MKVRADGQSSLWWLKLGHSKLPELKAPLVSVQKLPLRLGAAHAMSGVVIDPQQHRFAAGSCSLQASRHLARLPRCHSGIIEAGGHHNRGISSAILHVSVSAHLVESLEAISSLDSAKLRD